MSAWQRSGSHQLHAGRTLTQPRLSMHYLRADCQSKIGCWQYNDLYQSCASAASCPGAMEFLEGMSEMYEHIRSRSCTAIKQPGVQTSCLRLPHIVEVAFSRGKGWIADVSTEMHAAHSLGSAQSGTSAYSVAIHGDASAPLCTCNALQGFCAPSDGTKSLKAVTTTEGFNLVDASR